MSDTKAARIVGGASACFAQGGRITSPLGLGLNDESVCDTGVSEYYCPASPSCLQVPSPRVHIVGRPFLSDSCRPCLARSFAATIRRYSNPEWNMNDKTRLRMPMVMTSLPLYPFLDAHFV